MSDLTADDLALAQMAAGLAIAWHRQQPNTGFKAQEIKKLTALIAKLDATMEWAGRFSSDDLIGDEVLMTRAQDKFGSPECF